MCASSFTTRPQTSLSRRAPQPEWMDEPDLDPALHRQALAGLARLNRFGGSAGILWRALRPLSVLRQPLRVLDLACGGGDVTLALARRAARQGLAWSFTGIDKSEVALQLAAQRASQSGLAATFVPCDVLRDVLPDGFDVVTCSLFLHHLSDADAESVLRRAAASAQRLLLVSDLRRSSLNYGLTWIGCQLLTRSPVVHVDGPISLRAAFTIAEAHAMAKRAGLQAARIAPRFPVRWLLEWSPS